ncbi:MucBP domain-containing protein, partial [Enterococcus ureilyticus]
AIFNDVDTSKAGTYTITYRLENVMAGTFIDKTMTVIVQDSILGADVTIHYQDTEGNTIAPDVVKSGNIGDPYSFEQLTIDGYTFKEVNGNPNGTFTDTAQTVTYVYTKNTINQPLEPTKPSESYTKPVVKAKTINSASTTATLPQTGETNSPLLTDVGAMILLASGAYILTFKRKKSN